MASDYYTSLTRSQVNLIYAAASHERVHLSREMTDYLYFIARAGSGFAHSRVEEDFRTRVRSAVTCLMKSEDEEADRLLHEAFRLACASWDSERLRVIRRQLG